MKYLACLKVLIVDDRISVLVTEIHFGVPAEEERSESQLWPNDSLNHTLTDSSES